MNLFQMTFNLVYILLLIKKWNKRIIKKLLLTYLKAET
jgi:hypothetical protein